MIPGPDQVLQCPACGAALLQPTIRSGNTLDAVHYTDGYMDAPMLPQPVSALEQANLRKLAAQRIRQLVADRHRWVSGVFAGEE